MGSLTKKFGEVKNPVWDKFKKSNGFFEKYFDLRTLMNRGKSHPQIIFSMTGEWAQVIILLSWIGVDISVKNQMMGMLAIIFLILVVGYADVYFEVARKESSYNTRFKPEQQRLFKQIEEIHQKIFEKGSEHGIEKTTKCK